MKLSLAAVIGCTAFAIAGSAAAAPEKIHGTWTADGHLPGVSGFFQLTFTRDGQLLADGKTLLGRFEVRGSRVTARSSFGETYVYDLQDDGRLCVHRGPGFTPLAGEAPSLPLAATPCFRRVSEAA